MWFEIDVPSPSKEIEFPERLLWQIEDFIEGLQRIDILVNDEGRWVKVNALHVERAYSREEAPLLAMKVKIAADKHVRDRARGAKFRAMIRRHVGPERERRVVTFDVETESERRRRERMERFEDMPDTPFRAWWLMFETLAADNLRLFDKLIEQQRILDQIERRTIEDLTLLMRNYYEGLLMQEEVMRERAELQMEQALATMRAKSTAKAWETFGPTIEGLVEYVRQQVVEDELDGGNNVIKRSDRDPGEKPSSVAAPAFGAAPTTAASPPIRAEDTGLFGAWLVEFYRDFERKGLGTILHPPGA